MATIHIEAKGIGDEKIPVTWVTSDEGDWELHLEGWTQSFSATGVSAPDFDADLRKASQRLDAVARRALEDAKAGKLRDFPGDIKGD